MKLKKNIIYLLIAIAGFMVFTARTGYAANIANISFEYPTLFSELNILPGDSVTRYIKAENISGRSIDLTIKSYNISDYDHLSDRFEFSIKKGPSEIFSGSMSAFFAAGEFTLDTLAPGETAQYDLTAAFKITTGNAYQEKTMGFNIAVFAYDENGNSTGGGGLSASGFSGSRSASPPPNESPRVLGEAGAPELVVEKSADREFAHPGDRIIYTVKILNRGNLEAYDVALSDFLPDGLFYATDESVRKSWMIGDLNTGEERTISYEAIVSADRLPGPAINQATASASNHDPVSSSFKVEIRPVSVFGKILTKTGFSRNEFFTLTGILLVLTVLIIYLKIFKYREKINSKKLLPIKIYYGKN